MSKQNIKVVSVAGMQALEAASERLGVSTDTLMENAGLACARYIRDHMGGAAGRSVLLLIGPGNNGADGLVIARHLQRWGADALCYIARGRPAEDPKMLSASRYGVPVASAENDPDFGTLRSWLSRSTVVVDAVLGAGRYRPLQDTVADIADCVNLHRRDTPATSIVAIDLPTGVNPDTGAADERTIAADITLALCCPKIGVANFPGAGLAGRIEVLSIGLHPDAYAEFDLPIRWMSDPTAAELLPPRPLDSHKGTYGHLLIVAGSRNFVGAAVLAATAAHRIGAGLVTLATPSSVYPIVASKLTETIHLPLPEGPDGRIHASAADLIGQRVSGYSALAVGCGLGWSPGTIAFIERLLLSSQAGESPSGRKSRDGGNPLPPVVIDADGLNNLASCADWPSRLNAASVLTPHPGEMSTLSGLLTADVQTDRLSTALESARQWNQTVLLKGAHTVASDAAGRQSVIPFANPALAAGGTGDVLTGIIGGLMAQRLAPYDAATLGAYLHGKAAQAVSERLGPAGVVASDLVGQLPLTMNQLRGVVQP